ncbi:MAG: lipid A deacylase LpxR family protein [Desulfuromonadales bacterium]|nr:lipid A deacylase LpxR family protein [Desulfuromonadales bacterium]
MRILENYRLSIIRSVVCILFFTAGTVYGQDPPSFDAGKPEGVERTTWLFEFTNDFFFNKDNQISGGWSLQRHSAVASHWETLEGVPMFVKQWGKKIPTLTKDGLVYRTGVAISQVTQTPENGKRSVLIKDDVPYVGVLTLQSSWYAFNDNEFRGFEITAGVVGPASLAEETQKTVHKLTGNNDPKGWDNQLETEPVFNLNYMRKHKVWRWGNPGGLSFDTAINGNVGVGNLMTQASTALEMRFGHNMPGGFVYVPDPIGVRMHYIAALKPENPRTASLYASLVLFGSAIAYNIFLDGNTFHDSHSVAKEPLVGVTIAGLHYERNNWGIHCSVMATTDDVDRSKAPAAEGRERLGVIDVKWQF